MIHSLRQQSAPYADFASATAAMDLALRKPTCVAARVTQIAANPPWRLEIYSSPSTGSEGVRVALTDAFLAVCQHGHGWVAWRREVCAETALDTFRLLRTAGYGDRGPQLRYVAP